MWSDKIGGGAPTLNVMELLGTPAAITTTGPFDAPEGTRAVMLELDQLDTTAEAPLNLTKPGNCVLPNCEPLMATMRPTHPEFGERVVIVGGRGAGTTIVES